MKASNIAAMDARPYYPQTTTYLIEREVLRQGVCRIRDISKALIANYGRGSSPGCISAALAALMARGAVYRVSRGVYAHRDSPSA